MSHPRRVQSTSSAFHLARKCRLRIHAVSGSSPGGKEKRVSVQKTAGRSSLPLAGCAIAATPAGQDQAAPLPRKAPSLTPPWRRKRAHISPGSWPCTTLPFSRHWPTLAVDWVISWTPLWSRRQACMVSCLTCRSHAALGVDARKEDDAAHAVFLRRLQHIPGAHDVDLHHGRPVVAIGGNGAEVNHGIHAAHGAAHRLQVAQVAMIDYTQTWDRGTWAGASPMTPLVVLAKSPRSSFERSCV